MSSSGPDTALRAAAESSIVVRRLRALAKWVGEGRKLTQTGRISLADARSLVELLGTEDVMDPTIGGRVFRTKSSQELIGLNVAVEWAKAARLLRVTGGRLVPVKKSMPLLQRPLELWDQALAAFFALGPALYPSGYWAEPLLHAEFQPVMTALLTRLYGGAVSLTEVDELSWEIASRRYVFGDGSEEARAGARRLYEGQAERALRALEELGAVDRVAASDEGMATLTPLGLRGVRRFLGESGPGEPVFQVLVRLEEITDPSVWRRLQVSAGIRLDRLHSILQAAMGWTDSHLHMFAVGGSEYSNPAFELETAAQDERQVRLAELVRDVGTVIHYVYDFGDGWRHQVVVEKMLQAEENLRYPICLAGRGACPPEDCGGPAGYTHLREAVPDPDHPEHEEYRSWLGLDDGAEFDPEHFELGEVNQALRRITAG